MSGRRRKAGCLMLVALAAAMVGGWVAFRMRLAPPGGTTPVLVRVEERSGLRSVLGTLQQRRIVRDARAAFLYARLSRVEGIVGAGTYRLRGNMTLDEVFRELKRPIRQMVRLPETNWMRRNANLLERAGVTTAEEYLRLGNAGREFQATVEFPLPEGSLEGYLLPDTYDLPPLLGARGVIERQLQAFERKVWEPLGKPQNLRRALIVASMVELEVMRDNERPIVAGVIENRLRLGMPLQIDATVNYAMQEWRELSRADLRRVASPYNTYLNRGLPPGPICSPSVKSIQAALRPARHDYLYYVALPTGEHLFSRTYAEHNQNIAKRRAALRAREAAGR